MTATPSARFSKINWLNFHHNDCSKLAKNTFETMLIGDSILWRALNLPVLSNLKIVVVLCGTNNLLLDSPKDIVDGVLEIARSFKANYSTIVALML